MNGIIFIKSSWHYISKVFFAIRIRGIIVVLRQLVAHIILVYLPLTMLDKYGYKFRTFLLVGYWPNDVTPESFNEKILYRRKVSDNELASIIADKWSVRQYLKTLGYESILNKVLFVTENPSEIEFDSLPEKFAIKANYSSGLNIIINNKDGIDPIKIIAKCNGYIYNQSKILKRNPEIHYRKIKPKIIIEKFIEGDREGLCDYKFWCFNGVVNFITVQKLINGIKVSFAYDKEWKQLPFSISNRRINFSSVAKPDCLEEMVKIAERLSKDFDFIRVDLYCAKGMVVFGELTYNPSGGTAIFFPKKYDKLLGKQFLVRE